MNKKNDQIKPESLEIIELAIDDLTTLARSFDLIGELANRGWQFIEPVEGNSESNLLH